METLFTACVPYIATLCYDSFEREEMVMLNPSRGMVNGDWRIDGLICIRAGARLCLLFFVSATGCFEIVDLCLTDACEQISLTSML